MIGLGEYHLRGNKVILIHDLDFHLGVLRSQMKGPYAVPYGSGVIRRIRPMADTDFRRIDSTLCRD
jgi:hypothetical protein